MNGDLSVVSPDPKPARGGGIGRPKKKGWRRFRIVATTEQWKTLREEKLGPCYVCRWRGVVQALESSLHHVVSKSLGGDDVAENLVPLCGDGVLGCHGRVEAHDPGTCRDLAAAIQQYDDPVYAYAIQKLGEDGWLRRLHVFERSA